MQKINYKAKFPGLEINDGLCNDIELSKLFFETHKESIVYVIEEKSGISMMVNDGKKKAAIWK